MAVDRELARRNLRTGLLVGAVAAAFLIGFLLKMYLSQ
jgi:hypothetical protein